MKKLIAMFAIFVCVSSALSAQFLEFSAGGGAVFDMSFGNGDKTSSFKTGLDTTGIGGFVYFDATYLEVNVYFLYNFTQGWTKTGDDKREKQDGSGLLLSLGFSVLGKIPLFDFGSISLYPLLGISYNMVLSGRYYHGTDIQKPLDFSQFGILAGAGIDYSLNRSLYIRAEALCQMRFPNEDMRILAKGEDREATFGFGPVVKIGLGYRF